MRKAEEIINEFCQDYYNKDAGDCQFIHPNLIINAMQAYAKEALEEAAEQAQTTRKGYSCDCEIDQDTITNIVLP